MDFTKTKVSIKKWFFQDMPEAATPEEWDEWNTQAQANKVRWFFAKILPDWFVSVFIYPYENIRSKLKNKYIRKYNLIKIHSLKATEWHSTDSRLMHGMFQLLVDLVELEKAHLQIVFSEDNLPKYMYKANYRSAKMGMKYIDWEISLGKEGGINQSKNAKKIKDLYIWWADARPKRTDLMNVKGPMGVSTNEYYEDTTSDKTGRATFSHIGRKKDENPELYESVNKAYNDAEEMYEKEDEKMLIQLIKLRKYLWT